MASPHYAVIVTQEQIKVSFTVYMYVYLDYTMFELTNQIAQLQVFYFT